MEATAAATWFAPRDPSAPRGSLAQRLHRVARHLAKRDRGTLEAEVRRAQEMQPQLALLDAEAFSRHVAQVRRDYRLQRAERKPGAPQLTLALATVAAAAVRTVGLTPSFPQFLAALAMAD